VEGKRIPYWDITLVISRTLFGLQWNVSRLRLEQADNTKMFRKAYLVLSEDALSTESVLKRNRLECTTNSGPMQQVTAGNAVRMRRPVSREAFPVREVPSYA
jgi:hypothetical protein